MIRKNGDILELDAVFLDFFEQVLGVNEAINLASIDENIKSIKENIKYFLNEHNQNRKYRYLREIKKTFRKIGNITYKSVIDLRRNVDNTYKNEANYKNKILKLKSLDEKRTEIKNLIDKTLKLIDEETTFFNRALDEELRTITEALKYRQFKECSDSLIEIEKQIIDYLNEIKIQGKLPEKLRKLKYLRDHFTIKAGTDIEQVLWQ